MYTTSGFKEIEMSKFELVAKTQFLECIESFQQFSISFQANITDLRYFKPI